MKIDVEVFAKKLYDLKNTKNLSWSEITKKTGVHNLSRIANGEIKKPTLESWWAIHKAFPKEVPEPSYIGGKPLNKNIVVHTENNSIINKYVLSPLEQNLIDELRLKNDKDIQIKRILSELFSTYLEK